METGISSQSSLTRRKDRNDIVPTLHQKQDKNICLKKMFFKKKLNYTSKQHILRSMLALCIHKLIFWCRFFFFKCIFYFSSSTSLVLVIFSFLVCKFDNTNFTMCMKNKDRFGIGTKKKKKSPRNVELHLWFQKITPKNCWPVLFAPQGECCTQRPPVGIHGGSCSLHSFLPTIQVRGIC